MYKRQGIYGAVVYTLLKTFVSRSFAYWELVVGLILLGVVLASPGGIAALIGRLGGKRSREAS